MPETPAITVLMPAYNAGSYIREAIDSVLQQTFTDFEFLIIDDGSKDNTPNILKEYSDPRIRIISRPNKGLIASLNEGLQEARASLIARHDADDVMRPHRLEHQFDFFQQHPDYAIIGSDMAYIDREGVYVARQEAPDGHSDEEIRTNRFYKCPFIHPTVLFQKDMILAVGGYPNGAILFEDWLLWIRVMETHKVCNLKEVLMYTRINPESVTIDERWRPTEFHELRLRSLKQGFVTNADASRLAAIVRAQSFTGYKEASYHAFVAKKYLWSNPQPKLARAHLRSVIKHYPKNKEPYVLYALSFLPKAIMQLLYKAVKSK